MVRVVEFTLFWRKPVGLDFAKLDKDHHLRLYEMFCSSWILKGGTNEFPITGDRHILDEILTYGKISVEEALEIESKLREMIPEFQEFFASLDQGLTNTDTKH